MSQDWATARQSTHNRVKTLINNDLKEICRQEGLAVSGVKSQLQQRILAHLDDAFGRNDQASFERIRYRAMHRGESPPLGWPGFGSGTTKSVAPSTITSGNAANQQQQQHHRPLLPPPPTGPRAGSSVSHLSFKPSPFYTIVDHLTHVITLPEMPANRHTIPITLRLGDQMLQMLQGHPNLRVMLYCTADSLLQNGSTMSDISFPAQVEVKVNQEDVKHNFKGLKNKPGTTKPADLTDLIRKVAGYGNILNVNYALTSRRYSMIVSMVRKASVETLTERIRSGNIISKAKVIEEMINKANDPDIVATSYVMSLKDPVSTMRIELPCRSTICSHYQCFDASSFIQLQEQAPTWTCPICNKTVSYSALVIDHYMLDILQKTSRSTDQVTVEPNGEWHEISQKQDNNGDRGKTQARAVYDADSDDDLVEIIEPTGGVTIKKDPGQSTPAIAQQTPPLSSREASAPSNTGKPGTKRPTTLIDLTLSDDDEPPRPAKRQSAASSVSSSYSTPNSNHDRSREFQPPQARPPPPTFYQRQYAQMTSPPLSTNGTSPGAPDPSRTHLPWPQNYASYGSPWRIQMQPNSNDGTNRPSEPR